MPYPVQLNEHKFTTEQLCAGADISYNTFTNYMRSGLEFASPSRGQGRARVFALIDVYSVALLDALTVLTSKPKWAAEVSNFAVREWPMRTHNERDNGRLSALLFEDIKNAHPGFSERGDPDWFLIVNAATLTGRSATFVALMTSGVQIREAVEGADRTIRLREEAGLFLNLTQLCDAVDRQLAELVELKGDGA